jgi:hypothetical protein
MDARRTGYGFERGFPREKARRECLEEADTEPTFEEECQKSRPSGDHTAASTEIPFEKDRSKSKAGATRSAGKSSG